MGEQVIDLEGLAGHQGSAYGTMNTLVQPTQEQFENELANQLNLLNQDKPVWLEDESIMIGKRVIPNPLWRQMREANVNVLKVPPEQRVGFLLEEYGKLDKTFLKDCTEKIRKRLGPLQTKNALLAIDEDRMADFIRIVLVYYDKTYRLGLEKRKTESITEIDCPDTNAAVNAELILALHNKAFTLQYTREN